MNGGRMGVQQILERHEIKHLSVSPQPYRKDNKANGFDITIAECMCGHTAPLGNRAAHLAEVLI